MLSLLDAPTQNQHCKPVGTLKQTPADFIVEEVLGIELEGAGEHLWLRIRKCGLNTEDVARELKTLFAAADVDVGFSGLKDKHAITEQWFSVRTSLDHAILPTTDLAIDKHSERGWYLVEAHRHSRKLRRGAHKRNRFTLRLRDLTGVDASYETPAEQIAAHAIDMAKTGFPNYYGLQRFGIDGANLRKAGQHFQNPRRKITRTQRGFCISAARSALFNHVCAERVRDGSIGTPMPGEPMVLQGSHSYFSNEGDEDVTMRCSDMDIHTSGPLWGRGQPLGNAPYLAIEAGWLAGFSLFKQGLERAGLKQERRSLRAIAHQLHCHIEDDHTVLITVELDPSVYATVLLNELVDRSTQLPS